MKKITYKERSKFYSSEIEKNKYLFNFLIALKNRLKINSTVLIPCASGIYSDDFSKVFELNYFMDIEESMIEELKLNLSLNKIKNIYPLVKNMNDSLNIKVDAIFVLDQGIQFLNHKEFYNFLKIQMKFSKYIILDMYDFFSNNDDKLNYYNNKENINYKEFIFNNKLYKREITYKKDSKGIKLFYNYNNDKHKNIYNSNIYLYNYNLKQTINIINSIKKIKIKSIYKNYLFEPYLNNNRYILILEVTK